MLIGERSQVFNVGKRHTMRSATQECAFGAIRRQWPPQSSTLQAAGTMMQAAAPTARNWIPFSMSRHLTFALLAFASMVHAQQRAAPSRPVFREVQFPPYASIRLGESMWPNSPPGQRGGEDRIVLSGFGGTDSIAIQLDRSGHVVALQFVYPNSSSYSSFIDGYLASLGQPTSRLATDSAGGRVERAVWQDSLTRFELRQFSRGARTVSLTALLSDHHPNPR